jgi:hypothetical protein
MSRHRRFLTLGLGLMFLLIAALPAAAQEGITGSAPVRTEKPWPLPFTLGTASRAASPAVGCAAGYCLFLPVVQQPAPWIDTRYKAVTLAAYQQQYFVPEAIKPEWWRSWTGSHDTCNPGDVSVECKAAILRRINYFRGMAGVPANISFDSEYSRKAQAAALMISVNRNTNVPPPGGTCWSMDGLEGYAYSLRQAGGFGVDAIKGWMRDKSDGAVANRRWILYPQTEEMGTGNVPKKGDDNDYGAALWVIDANEGGPRPKTRDAYVAWPPPGYVPYPVVFARWSFTYPGAYFDQAAVTMTENGVNVPVVYTQTNDTWENTLVWIDSEMAADANWPKPQDDTVYHVTISNVKIGLELRTFSYDVIIFDPDA